MKKALIFFLAPLLFVPFFVFAQSDEEIAKDIMENSDWPTTNSTMGGVDCFDYYTFQSVSVSVGTDQDVYQPGTPIHFSGTVTNENDYPIVDGTLFVRIGKKNENFVEEGNYIVDEFIAMDHVSINAQSTKNVDFTWDVSQFQSAGEYTVDYFFSVGKKFNLGGLPFSNDIVAGTAVFNVSSTINNYVSFQKDKTTFNGEKYYHIGSWPSVLSSESAVVKNILYNSFDEEKEVTITHKLYRWDSLNEDDLLEEHTEIIIIPGKSAQDITYDIAQLSEAVYYLKTTATYDGDVESIINVRFSTDATRARLNYPGITKFPIHDGDQFTLFTCFHNTSLSNVEGEVDVRITDQDGGVIGTAHHQGSISSAMSAIKSDITAKDDYEYIKLIADVKDVQGNIVDHYEAVYDCAQIDSCREQSIMQGKNWGIIQIMIFTVFVIVSAIVIAVLFQIVRKRRVTGMLVFATLFSVGLLMGQQVLALGDRSVTASKNYTLIQSPGWFNVTLASGTVSVNHAMSIASGNTNLGCGGSIGFRYDPQLTFNGSGGNFDTPYGKFCDNYTSSSCFGGTMPTTQRVNGDSGRYGYIYFTGSKPRVTSLTSSNPSIVTCSGMTCTAVSGSSGGTARITAKLSDSSVRAWSIINVREDRANISCSGTILGHPRCTSGVEWYSPTEENKICGGGGCISGQGVNFLTMGIPAPGGALSWDVTVASCSVNGACNPAATRNDYAYTATGPSTPLCSAGTPSPATVSFPAGAYGASSAVNWTCAGSGGGTTATCSAARLAPAASCGTANGVMTNIKPATNLCGAGSILVNPPGVALNGATWQWSCRHSVNPGANPQTVTCSAPTPSVQCVCNPAATRNDYAYTATGPSTPLCSAGTPSPATVSFPAGAYGAASAVNWTCSAPPCTGVGCASSCMGSTTCSASRMSPPQCDCGSVDTVSIDKPSINLCNPTLSSGPTVFGNNGVWSWTCQDPSVCTGSATCTAECVNINIDAPANIYLNKNGNKLKVKVRVEGHKNVQNGGTCSITMNSETQIVTVQNGGSTPEVEFDYVGAGARITAECTLEVACGGGTLYTTKTLNDEHFVTSLCAERTCNSQGSCQSTPKSGVTSVSDCVSTCNSDADCSRGRMIETRP